MLRFSPDGSPAAADRLELPHLVHGVAASGDGYVVHAWEQARDGAGAAELLLLVQAGVVAPLVRAAREDRRLVEMSKCRLRFPGRPVFAPVLRWAARGDTIAVVEGNDYRIDVYIRGERALAFGRDLPARASTRTLAQAALAGGLSLNWGGHHSCVVEPAAAVDALGVAPSVPAVARLAVAPDGGLWVERYRLPGEPAESDVFSAGGEYLGTLPRGAPVPAAFLPGRRIAALEEDEAGVECVVLYRLEGPSFPFAW